MDNDAARAKGDLISREALKHKFAQITYVRFTADMGQGGFEMFSEKEIEDIIDKAPAVEAVSLEHHNKIKGIIQNEVDSLVEILDKGQPSGEWVRKEDVIHHIAAQYSAHNELVPAWLSIGDMRRGE